MARFRLIVLPVVFALAFCAQNILPAQAQSSLGNGLIACWDMTEPSGPRADATSNNNHLTDNNTVGSVAGLQGVAASFVRTSSEYLSIPAASAPLLKPGATGQFTVTGWMYQTDNAYNILYTNIGTVVDFYIGYSSGAGGYVLSINNNATQVTRPTAITNAWVFVSAWFDGTAGVAGLQINNGTVYTSTIAAIPTTATNIYVGRRSSEYMNGYIDTVTHHNRVLSQSERTELYNNGSGVTCESIVATGGTTTISDGSALYEVALPSGAVGTIKQQVTAGDMGIIAVLSGVGLILLFDVMRKVVYGARHK